MPHRFFLFFLITVPSFLIAQEQTIEVLEKTADSLYYSQHDKYSEISYLKILQLRKETMSKISDTNTSKYKKIHVKLYASKAANFEFQHKFDSAIFYSKKYLKSMEGFKKQNLFFKGHALIHLYTQTAYNGDWKTATKYCKEALQILKDTLGYNNKLIPEVEFDYGYAISQSGDYITELKYYNLSKDHYIDLIGENNHEVALKYAHLAIVYSLIGYSNKELDAYKKAIKIWETIDYKDKSYLSVEYGSISSWYIQHGDYEKAEQYLNKKEKLIKENINKDWINETYKGRTQVEIWGNYSNLYLQKKDTVKALLFTNKGLDFLTHIDINDLHNNPNNRPYFKDWVQNTKIETLRFNAKLIKNSKPEEAKDIYNYILSQKKKGKFSNSTTIESINLSNYYLKKKNYKKAHETLNNVLFQNKKEDSYLLLQVFAAKAYLYFKESDFLRMHEKYHTVFKSMQLDTLQNIALHDLKYHDCKPYGAKKYISIVLNTASNYRNAYNKTKHKEYLQIAHNLNLFASEMFAENYAVFDYNDKTYNEVIHINEQLLSTSLALNDETIFDEVLQKIEQSSSRLSWQKFLNSTQRRHINIPDSILTKESELKTQLHFYKKTLFLNTETNSQKRNLWKKSIFDLKNEIEELNKWFQKKYPSYFNQNQKEFNVNDLKQKLRPNQQIIKYIFTKENIYAFIISKKSTKLIKVSNKNIVTESIQPFIASLSKPNSSEYKKIANTIYKFLLPKNVLNTMESSQQLVFILDDILYYVPMETLIDTKGDFLIENHAISYASSLLLWNEQLQVETSSNSKFGVFSPSYIIKKNNPKRNDDNELKGANKEALEIAKQFNADIFLGIEANKQSFLKKAQNYNVLHLAMHSNINNIDSEFSNFVFPETQGDGKLYISELYNLNLNADLAVLSACNTAIGNMRKGEGLVNVSKAFTYAGVPSTVTSLWKVPDNETAKIMISFYEHLKKGQTKDKALQKAKLVYLNSTKDESLRHPYYWAGFVVSGNMSPLQISTPFNWYVVNGGVLILGLTGLIFLYFRRKSTS